MGKLNLCDVLSGVCMLCAGLSGTWVLGEAGMSLLGCASFGEGRGGFMGVLGWCKVLGEAGTPVLSIGWDELGIISQCVLAFLKAGARLQHSDQVLAFMVSPPQGPTQAQAAGASWAQF